MIRSLKHAESERINPFQKPIENDALSAKWNVHIWNRLWKCSSRLYAGTLKTPGLQRSNFRRLKINQKFTSRPFAISAIFITPQSKREMRAAMLRGGRRPTNLANLVNSVNLVLLDYWAGLRLLEVRTATFSCDSSWKWQSLWSAGENLDRRW